MADDDDMSARTPTPPGAADPPEDPAATPPLALTQIVPSRTIIQVMPTDHGPAVCMRTESLNGSFFFGYAPAEARNLGALIMKTADAADEVKQSPSKLIVPDISGPALDRLMRDPRG